MGPGRLLGLQSHSKMLRVVHLVLDNMQPLGSKIPLISNKILYQYILLYQFMIYCDIYVILHTCIFTKLHLFYSSVSCTVIAFNYEAIRSSGKPIRHVQGWV